MSSPSFLGVATQRKGPRGSSSRLIADNSLLPWPCPRLVYAEKVVQRKYDQTTYLFAQQPIHNNPRFSISHLGVQNVLGLLMAAMRMRVRCFQCFPK